MGKLTGMRLPNGELEVAPDNGKHRVMMLKPNMVIYYCEYDNGNCFEMWVDSLFYYRQMYNDNFSYRENVDLLVENWHLDLTKIDNGGIPAIDLNNAIYRLHKTALKVEKGHCLQSPYTEYSMILGLVSIDKKELAMDAISEAFPYLSDEDYKYIYKTCLNFT